MSGKPKSAYHAFKLVLQATLGRPVVSEYRFAKESGSKRQWRADFAIPCCKVLVEVEGGIWSRGRHVRPKGYINDIEKYNAAALLGFRVYRVIPTNLMLAKTLDEIKQLCEDAATT